MASSNVESEYKDIADRNGWAVVYQKIARTCIYYDYTCNEARKPQNKLLNRYRDVNPYDHTRVVLNRGSQDYINANLVKMERANRKYILTQGPLPDTVGHFWLMVWEQNSHAILMLNKIIEKHEIKCHTYWPTGEGPKDKLTLEDVQLEVEQLNTEDFSYYCTRLFRLTDLETGEHREIIQFHYTTWPDFGVPSSPYAFLEFLRKVRDSGALDSNVGPAIVHCSAGIGRSGTFCLVDSCLVLIEKEGLNSVNIQEILLEMRKDRMGLIQTPDQLRFSYEAIIAGSKIIGNDEELNHNLLKEQQEWAAITNDCAPEDSPPPPPPRGASLHERPLPPIPHSRSLDDISHSEEEGSESDETESSSDGESDEAAPPIPSSGDNSHDEDEEINDRKCKSESPASSLRRRKVTKIAQQVSAMKRKQQQTENWIQIKKRLVKPAAVTLALIVCGVVVYVYVNK